MAEHATFEDSDADQLSAREHAALQLRLPDSGTPWLDEMIVKARRMDIATKLEAAYIVCIGKDDDGPREPVEFLRGLAEISLEMADALIDEALSPPRVVADPNAIDLTAHQFQAPPAPKPSWPEPEPAVPNMTVDGVEYVEARERFVCGGCAFNDKPINKCIDIKTQALAAFGGDCLARGSIYLRKESGNG